MTNFKPTESITRRLTGIILSVAALFVIGFGVLYFVSRTSLQGLTNLYQINAVYDLTRQTNQIVLSQAEILRKSSGADRHSLELSRLSTEQTRRLFRKALDLGGIDPAIRRQIAESEKATDLFQSAAEAQLGGSVDFAKGSIVTDQYELEARDLLARTQIALKTNADLTFEQIYADRFRPLVVVSAFSLVFVVLSLFLGFGLRRRMDRSIGNLVDATRKIGEGDLGYRAEVLHPDEIGLLTHSFNRMTETLRSSTVSKDYLANVIESMQNAVLMLDTEKRIVQTNHVVQQVFGIEAKDLLGRPWSVLFEREKPDDSDSFHENATGLAKDGRRIPVSLALSPLVKGGDGGFVCVAEDITERLAAEKLLNSRNLELANANRELEAFSYSVSHDLRAPLRGIDGFSQALWEDLGPALDEEKRDYLQRIRSGVQKMGALIDNMLELSKLTRKELRVQSTDLSRIAETIVRDLRERDPERKVTWIVDGDMQVEGDTVLLTALLENLIGNAWKYTSKVAEPRIEFKVERKNGERVFSVSDNGAGFDMNYYGKLFGAFQRLHRDSEFPGTGVGLAIVQRILHRHGGRIWAESAVGKGATFYFFLPEREESVRPSVAATLSL